jgi:sugar lactone lactonase YvrE
MQRHGLIRIRSRGRGWLVVALAVLLGPALPASAHKPAPLPAVLHLPDGFQPEGITRGGGHQESTLYVTGIASGGIFAIDARTDKGSFLVPPRSDGRKGLGIKYDSRRKRLVVAGGDTGHAYVYDARTGASLADLTLATAQPGNPTFINDVILSDDNAYFTDSNRLALYKVALGHLAGPNPVKTIPLGGDYQSIPGQFNANGIETTPDGRALLVVNSFLGTLYRVDPRTGFARLIDLGGRSVKNGDGLVRDGRTLYVVENFSNQIDVVRLGRDDRGEVVRTIGNADLDPRAQLDIPATAALLCDALYVTNARFTTPPTPSTPYSVTRVPLRR